MPALGPPAVIGQAPSSQQEDVIEIVGNQADQALKIDRRTHRVSSFMTQRLGQNASSRVLSIAGDRAETVASNGAWSLASVQLAGEHLSKQVLQHPSGSTFTPVHGTGRGIKGVFCVLIKSADCCEIMVREMSRHARALRQIRRSFANVFQPV